MNKKNFTIIACAAALILTLALAKSEEAAANERAAATPPRQTVAKVPENATWTVTWRHRGDLFRENEVRRLLAADKRRDPKDIEKEVAERLPDPATAGIEVVSIANAYSRGVRREVIQTRSGESLENYIAGGRVLFYHPGTGEPLVVPRSTSEVPSDPTRLGRLSEFVLGHSSTPGVFGEFQWVHRRNYVGQRDYAGRLCNVYQESLYDTTLGASAPESGYQEDDEGNVVPVQTGQLPEPAVQPMRKTPARTAYIDAATRLPVALENQHGLRLYQFGPPLETPLTIPESFVALARKQQERTERYHKRFSIPN